MSKINREIVSSRIWLIFTAIIVAIGVLCLCIVTYLVDPFFQYRYVDGQYLVSCKYSGAGLIKNYEYDTLLIGSSMTENFDMNLMRKELNCRPLHVNIGGMSDEDVIQYVKLANDVGKAKKYYICVDLAYFNGIQQPKTVEYLLDNDIVSKLKYSMSYESWFRMLPIDLGLKTFKHIVGAVPNSCEYKVMIDYYGYSGNMYTYGENVVNDAYKNGINQIKKVNNDGLYESLIHGIDTYFEEMDINNAEYVFFFPPYSALFWKDAREEGYYDIYLNSKEYFIEKCEGNAKIYDFQSAYHTMNLDNYRDTSHYSPRINDWMVSEFGKDDYVVNSSNKDMFREKLDCNIDRFVENVKE